jgi:hypothetical protein
MRFVSHRILGVMIRKRLFGLTGRGVPLAGLQRVTCCVFREWCGPMARDVGVDLVNR